MTMTTQTTTMDKKATGFALLTPEQRSELGRRGGKASQLAGKGRAFTPETARAANHKRRASNTPTA